MSEWSRGRPDDDQRRYPETDRDRRDFGRQDRWRGESRSFGPGGQGRREIEEWDDPQRAYGDQGYGSQAYGRQEWGGADSDDQRYRTTGVGARSYDDDRYAAPGYGGRTYSDERYGRGPYGARYEAREYRGGVIGDNEPLRRVADGETDPALSGAFGGGMQKGEHRGRGPRNYTRSDDRIHEDVNDRLTDDSWLDASNIDVAVAKGEVTLTGTVRTRDAKRRAEDLADAVSGVKHVQNNLRVQETAAEGAAEAKSASGVKPRATGGTST